MLFIAGGVFGLSVLACGMGGSSDDDGPVNAAPAVAGSCTVHCGDEAASPAPAKTKAGTIGDGTWTVGKEITKGTYRSPGTAQGEFCNWSVKSAAGLFKDAGVTEKTSDPQQVSLLKGQVFETSGCAVWVKQ